MNKRDLFKNGQPQSESSYQYLPISYDSDGYTVTFSLEEIDLIQSFFQVFGFVIIRNVLSPEECERSQAEVWQEIEKRWKGVKQDRPWTWETKNWPNHADIGILGDEPFLTPQLCENRQNPRIYEAYRLILETDRLRVDLDRCAMMRPTKDVLNEDGTTSDREDWRTSPFFHLDLYPWSNEEANQKADRLLVQGMVALKDCGPNDGGLWLVAGFPNYFEQWKEEKKKKYHNRFHDSCNFFFAKDDPLWQDLQPINLRSGSLCIFNQKTPHGARPNESSNGCLVQFLRMMKEEYVSSFYPLVSRETIPIPLTPLGEKLFGFADYGTIG